MKRDELKRRQWEIRRERTARTLDNFWSGVESVSNTSHVAELAAAVEAKLDCDDPTWREKWSPSMLRQVVGFGQWAKELKERDPAAYALFSGVEPDPSTEPVVRSSPPQTQSKAKRSHAKSRRHRRA